VVNVAFVFWEPLSLSAILCLILLMGSLLSVLDPEKVGGTTTGLAGSAFFSAAGLGLSFLAS